MYGKEILPLEMEVKKEHALKILEGGKVLAGH